MGMNLKVLLLQIIQAIGNFLSPFFTPPWLIAVGLLIAAVALAIRAYQSRREQRLQRLNFLRRAIRDFEGDPDIRNVLNILSFDSAQDFQVQLLDQDHPLIFKATEMRLCRALSPSAQRNWKNRNLIQKLEQSRIDFEVVDSRTSETEEHDIETVLRRWFNKFLDDLSHFEHFIESGLITAEELKPWLIRWLRLIADRQYKQSDRSKFDDQLYTYIHVAGYEDVEALFQRYGYQILPSPYEEDDLTQFRQIHQAPPSMEESATLAQLKTALSLAKASYLIYENQAYAVEIMGRWGIQYPDQDFYYIDESSSDTQAFLLRTDDLILLSFRGSQQTKDWKTNFSTKLKEFLPDTQNRSPSELATAPTKTQSAKVHIGFLSAWDSVAEDIVQKIKDWDGDQVLPLYVTGHSLGGALATIATAFLVESGIEVRGLYTFGQPRVGDIGFARRIGQKLKGRAFRFVNNNDVVPHVPPPWLPWNLFHFYVHIGQVRYFDVRGKLIRTTNRLWWGLDFLRGLLRGFLEPGFDLIVDHGLEYYISYLEQAVKLEAERSRLMR